MSDSLPEEIIIDILSRLLAESVLQCMLVCKSWRNLIYNDKSFSQKHSRRIYDHDSVVSVSSGKANFIQSFRIGVQQAHLKHLKYDADNHNKTLKLEIIDIIPPCNFFEVVGSSNGLVCISLASDKNIDDPIYICNPLTKEYVYLPKLSVNDLRSKDYVRSGFGYVSSTNEYKVVRIYCRRRKNEPFAGLVQVYTLGSGNGWRNTGDIISYQLYPSDSNEILVHGALHWFNEDGNVVAFDLAVEKFSVLPKPKITAELWNGNFLSKDFFMPCSDFNLRVLGGSLCIIGIADQRCIWSFKKRENLSRKNIKKRKRMHENKQEEHYNELPWSWKKDFDFGKTATYYDKRNRSKMGLSPFALLKNGAKILYHDNHYNYMDQDSGRRNIYNYRHIAHEYIPRDPVRYVKSFVSLKAIGEKEAKITEPSEGAHVLPRSDFVCYEKSDVSSSDSDIEDDESSSTSSDSD